MTHSFYIMHHRFNTIKEIVLKAEKEVLPLFIKWAKRIELIRAAIVISFVVTLFLNKEKIEPVVDATNCIKELLI